MVFKAAVQSLQVKRGEVLRPQLLSTAPPSGLGVQAEPAAVLVSWAVDRKVG